ncbi:MAG: ankyrin repeat domain-containing protein [Acidobacteriota bacterium]
MPLRRFLPVLAVLAVIVAACGMPAPDTPLGIAADSGDARSVNELLAKGADPNGMTSFGLTPLVIASRKGHDDVVRALIAGGARIDQVDAPPTREGWTPLMNAVHKNQARVCKTLIDAGANVNLKTAGGNSALRLAGSAQDLIQLLTSAGAS